MDADNILSQLKEQLKISSGDEVKAPVIISEICSGNIKLLAVVESMGEVLTNEDKTIRLHGVDFLSWILSELPPNHLNNRELAVITDFYCDRLNDHHDLLPVVIKGLLAIIQMQSITKEGSVQVLTQLFQHVNCQRQLQPDRYNIYSIFQYIVNEGKLDEVKLMGPDFVFGIISFTEGESDPANLLLLFHTYSTFLRCFDLGHLSEEMFEVLSGYFPVDFNSAERNNVIITREDLSVPLAECLSISSWSEFCMPLVLDKLDSSLKTAKLDSYKLLQRCCQEYKVVNLKKHLLETWKMIQKDILPGTDVEICKAGLSCLADVVKLLSSDVNESQTLLDFLSDVLASVKSLLNKVDDSLFQPAMNILSAVCSKSPTATKSIANLLKTFCSPDFTKTPVERKIVLTALTPFVQYHQNANIACAENPEEVASYLEIVNLFFTSASFENADVRRLAFVGIQKCLLGLSETSRARLYDIVVHAVRTEQNNIVRSEVLKVLRLMALGHTAEVSIVVCQHLLQTSDDIAAQCISASASLADIPQFTPLVIPRLLSLISDSRQHTLGLAALLSACRQESEFQEQFHQIMHKEFQVLDKLMSWWLDGVSHDMLEQPFSSLETLSVVSQIVRLLTRSQDADGQRALVSRYSSFSTQDDALNGSGDCKVDLLEPGIVGKTVMVLEAVLGSVRSEVLTDFTVLQSKLTTLSLTSSEDSIRTPSSRLLASLLNKVDETKALTLLETIVRDVWKAFDEPEMMKRSQGAWLLTWVMKAIILRGIKDLESWMTKWFELLSREDVGDVIAQGFKVVLEEDDYLRMENYCNIKILYRQRMFTYFPKLVSKYQTSENSVKGNYLLALSHLLQGVPKHVLLLEINSVIILLVQSLDTDSHDILLASLTTLAELLQGKEGLLSDYIGSFLTKLTGLTQIEGSMKIRIAALKCIYHYAFYPTPVVVPFRNQMTRNLEPCLDDKKRLVRSAAVRARNRWYLVGAPGEDSVFPS